jgi:predicted nucleic-acid-binding protein
MIPVEVVEDWTKNKKRILDRVNRIKKRLKKYNKQLAHFELRLRVIQKHEKESRQKEVVSQEADNQKDGQESSAQEGS